MSTEAVTNAQALTPSPEARPSRARYVIAALILSLTSMGALVLSSTGDNSGAPATNPAPAGSRVAPPTPSAQGAETFPGCLNDIECRGEPSHLPPGYWDPPVEPSVG